MGDVDGGGELMTRLRQGAHAGALAATATQAAASIRRGRAGAMALAATAAMAVGSVAGAAPDPAGASSVSAEAVMGSVAAGDRVVETAHRIPLARRDLAPGARQLVTVTSARFASTTATLRAWRRLPSGEWALAHGPVPAVIGYGGWVVAAKALVPPQRAASRCLRPSGDCPILGRGCPIAGSTGMTGGRTNHVTRPPTTSISGTGRRAPTGDAASPSISSATRGSTPWPSSSGSTCRRGCTTPGRGGSGWRPRRRTPNEAAASFCTSVGTG